MKKFNEFISENIISDTPVIGTPINKLSNEAQYHVKNVLRVIQLIDSKYKDWDKITMELIKPDHEIVCAIYYDNKFIGKFDKNMMPDNTDVIDELGWRHMN